MAGENIHRTERILAGRHYKGYQVLDLPCYFEIMDLGVASFPAERAINVNLSTELSCQSVDLPSKELCVHVPQKCCVIEEWP